MGNNGPLSSFYGPDSGSMYKVAMKKYTADKQSLAAVSWCRNQTY